MANQSKHRFEKYSGRRILRWKREKLYFESHPACNFRLRAQQFCSALHELQRLSCEILQDPHKKFYLANYKIRTYVLQNNRRNILIKIIVVLNFKPLK